MSSKIIESSSGDASTDNTTAVPYKLCALAKATEGVMGVLVNEMAQASNAEKSTGKSTAMPMKETSGFAQLHASRCCTGSAVASAIGAAPLWATEALGAMRRA